MLFVDFRPTEFWIHEKCKGITGNHALHAILQESAGYKEMTTIMITQVEKCVGVSTFIPAIFNIDVRLRIHSFMPSSASYNR